MPSQVTLHASDFRMDGYTVTLNLVSKSIPKVKTDPIIYLGLRSKAVQNASHFLERGTVFHISDFGMLQDRAISLASKCAPKSKITLGVGIALNLSSVSIPQTTVNQATNTLQITAVNVPECNISTDFIVPDDRLVRFGDLTFQSAKRTQPDDISAIIDEKLAKSGISEPVAFSRTITIAAETNRAYEHDKLQNLIGTSDLLYVYGIAFENARISKVSDLQRLPSLTRFAYTITFTHYKFTTADSVTFAGLTLSHPTIPNAIDTSPQYSVEMGAGFDLTNGIPKIVQRIGVECATETLGEFEGLLSRVKTGSRGELTVNGEVYSACYISALSKITPRGETGAVKTYTVEFTREFGVNPVSVSFDGITLPNCVYAGNSEREILTTRTPLESGKVQVDIGEYAAKRFSFSCMSNSREEYDQLDNMISQKKTLIVDGESWPKMYISSFTDCRIIGDGDIRIYQWEIGFEQETA